MADTINSYEATVHPVGWAFFGAGAIVWLIPVFRLLEIGATTLSDWLDHAWVLAATIFLFAVLGACVEFATRPLEPLLLRLTGLQRRKPSPHDWSIAWRTRWRFPTADAEFRRHEGVISLARAYLVHALLAGALWAAVIPNPLWAVVALVAAVLVGVFFVRLWDSHTFRVFLIVSSAAAWERDLHPGTPNNDLK